MGVLAGVRIDITPELVEDLGEISTVAISASPDGVCAQTLLGHRVVGETEGCESVGSISEQCDAFSNRYRNQVSLIQRFFSRLVMRGKGWIGVELGKLQGQPCGIAVGQRQQRPPQSVRR